MTWLGTTALGSASALCGLIAAWVQSGAVDRVETAATLAPAAVGLSLVAAHTSTLWWRQADEAAEREARAQARRVLSQRLRDERRERLRANAGLLPEAFAWIEEALRFAARRDHEGARFAFRRACRVADQLGTRADRARCLHYLGQYELSLGNLQAARKALLAAIDLLQRANDIYNEALAWLTLGDIETRRGATDEARAAYVHAARLHHLTRTQLDQRRARRQAQRKRRLALPYTPSLRLASAA